MKGKSFPGFFFQNLGETWGKLGVRLYNNVKISVFNSWHSRRHYIFNNLFNFNTFNMNYYIFSFKLLILL